MVKLDEIFRSPTFWAKIIELVMASLSVALFIADTTPLVETTKPKWAILLGTLIGYIMINIIIIIGTLVDSALSRPLILLITLPGAFLFFTSGGMLIEIWYHAKHSEGRLLGSAILTFLNGFIYLGDFALTFFKFG